MYTSSFNTLNVYMIFNDWGGVQMYWAMFLLYKTFTMFSSMFILTAADLSLSLFLIEIWQNHAKRLFTSAVITFNNFLVE